MYGSCKGHVRLMFIFLAEIFLENLHSYTCMGLILIWLLFTRTFLVLYRSCTGLIKGRELYSIVLFIYYINKAIIIYKRLKVHSGLKKMQQLSFLLPIA